MKAAALIPTILLSTISSAQESIVTEFDRYFDLSSNTLNEPCLIYNDVSYKAQFVLDDKGEDGLYWPLLSGEEVIDIPDNCESVMQSVFTTDPTIPFVSYNIENLIIVEGDSDTGLRYDIGSRADAGDYTLTVIFNNNFSSSNSIGLLLVYPIEFQVI